MNSPGIDAYRRQQLEAMSPEQLVLVAYDQGILACRNRDRRRARRVVWQLMSALDFERGDVADQLLLLYDWLLRVIREGNFAGGERIFTELRVTWLQAMNQEHERAAPAVSEAAGEQPSVDVAG